MMHLKFMSICDLLLFLLSVSSAVIFLTFTPLSSFANTSLSMKGKGMSYWDDRTSKKDACDIAELEAKKNAKNDPIVASVLSNFPGAEIKSTLSTKVLGECSSLNKII